MSTITITSQDQTDAAQAKRDALKQWDYAFQRKVKP